MGTFISYITFSFGNHADIGAKKTRYILVSVFVLKCLSFEYIRIMPLARHCNFIFLAFRFLKLKR